MRTDLLLLRCRASSADAVRQGVRAFCEGSGLDVKPWRAGWSKDSGWAYAYAQPGSAIDVSGARHRELAALWQRSMLQVHDADVSRLQLAFEAPAHSAGATPTRHYVVETDPEQGWHDELVRWYHEEHMPGLASVPGCILARRYVNADAGPASHAHYDLLREDVLGSPPWLAVRNTEWSSRVRPHFTNTRRTMMHDVL
jgi:hypothetical protein